MNISKTFVTAAAATVVGVFVAGLVMNQFRDNNIVRNAIKGYDA